MERKSNFFSRTVISRTIVNSDFLWKERIDLKSENESEKKSGQKVRTFSKIVE